MNRATTTTTENNKTKTGLKKDPSSGGHDQLEIPHLLIFSDKENILEKKAPAKVYENILHTIRVYQKEWNLPFHEDSIPENVVFQNDDDCLRLIRQVFPPLSGPFLTEKSGAYKGDICRLVALQKMGGYYFDVDMLALRPVKIRPGILLATANMSTESGNPPGFFQSFLACVPGHPLINKTLHVLFDYYQGKEMILQTFRKCVDTIFQLPMRKALIKNETDKCEEVIVKLYNDSKQRNGEKYELDFRKELFTIFRTLRRIDQTMRFILKIELAYVSSNKQEEAKRNLLIQQFNCTLTTVLGVAERVYDRCIFRNLPGLLGPRTMQLAYDRLDPTDRDTIYLMEEVDLAGVNKHMYPDWPRQKCDLHCCNFVVHDLKEWQEYESGQLQQPQSSSSLARHAGTKPVLLPYFVSRLMGATTSCLYTGNASEAMNNNS